MTSDMSASAVLEEPSFTLPARPGLLAPEPVDLLADPEPRRLPDGTVSGFAVIGALVAFSCLVGGLIGGFVVIGVSTLLAAIAALVHGRVSLSSVGGQRGAALLLGAAVTALIVSSVTAHQRSAAPESAEGVPVSSPFAVGTQTAYAAVPPSGDPAVPSVEKPAVEKPAVVRPAAVPAPPVQAPPAAPAATAPGLTLSLDALDPKPANANADDHGAAAASKADTGKGKATGKGKGKASDKASDMASEKASKAADKATRKAAAKAAKASEKAAKAALAEAAKAAREAAAQARQARALIQQTTKGTASTTRSVLGTVKRAEARTNAEGATKSTVDSTPKASKAAPAWGVSAKSAR